MNCPIGQLCSFLSPLLICFIAVFITPTAYGAKRFCPSAKFNILLELGRSEYIQDQVLMAKLNDSEHPETQLEIGAEAKPLCHNCLYVDASIQGLDLTRQAVKAAGFTFTGIHAQARELPFADQSITRIVLRNFSWQPNSTAMLQELRSVLVELKRVLKPEGEILVLSSTHRQGHILTTELAQHDLSQRMRYQKQTPFPEQQLIIHYGAKIMLAQKLGFKAISILTDTMFGMRLTL